MNSHPLIYLLICGLIISLTIGNDAEDTEGTTDQTTSISDVPGTLKTAMEFSEEFKECEFFFELLSEKELSDRQALWEMTRDAAKRDLSELDEVASDFRISNPVSPDDPNQPDLTHYYELPTNTLLSYDELRDPIVSADNELDDTKFLKKAWDLGFKDAPDAAPFFNSSIFPPNKVAPYFRAEIRMQKHRVCLFSLLNMIRGLNHRVQVNFNFMPGFVGINKKTALNIMRYYNDPNKSKELLRDIVLEEFKLSQNNRSSSMSLHGNFDGAKDSQVIYFSIWTKNVKKNVPARHGKIDAPFMGTHMSRGKRHAEAALKISADKRGDSNTDDDSAKK
ncbi:hypothetical protein niasHT_036453 [Heterodera trifolii]|uniref:Leucokinin n=1 Tax=Heterodera trifolii TaxID=157864 RepID=A0ABD2J086_9BILA